MSFSFGFSGDDIEEDVNDVDMQDAQANPSGNAQDANADAPPLIPAKKLELDDLLSTLPDKLSYTLLTTTSPSGLTATLPRREHFDIKLQLMAEDDGPSSTSSTTHDFTNPSDLIPNIYEGGFKTWECSLDLLSYLLERGPRKDLDDMSRVNHVVELGCGTALPSLLLWQYVLREGMTGMGFTLADYNEDVLRVVTLPNLLLTWATTLGPHDSPFSPENPNPLSLIEGKPSSTITANTDNDDDSAYLEITPEILTAFKQTITQLGLTLTLISGSWLPLPTFLSLTPSHPDLNTFILGSETIYSPSSLQAFAETIVGLMGRVRVGKTVVAAKRVYFGVGGSVDGFREVVAGLGGVAGEVEFGGLGEDGGTGVRRCLVEVQMC